MIAMTVRRAPDATARADGGQIADLGTLFDDDIFLDDAGRSDIGLGANSDRANNEFVSFDPRIGEIGVRSNARAGSDRDQIGGARLDLAEECVFADFRPERPQIEPHDGGALEPFDVNEPKETLHQPPAEVINTP
jgi:hypothetical protein